MKTAKPKKPPRPSIWSGVSPYGTYEGRRGSPEEWRGTYSDAWDYATAKRTIRQESPWEILGLPINSPWEAVKAAFRRLMLIHHPDKGGNEETCRKIISAYVVLKETYET